MITQHTEPNRPWVTASSIKKPGTVSLFYCEFKNPCTDLTLSDDNAEINENDKSVSNF